MCGTSLCTYRLMQPESSTPAQVSVYWSVHHWFKSKFNCISFRGRYCEPARVRTQIPTNRTDRHSPVTQSDTSSCRFSSTCSLLLPSAPELVVLLEPLHSVLQKVSSRAAALWDWTENSSVQLTANMKMLTYSEPQTPVSMVLFCLEPQCTAARKPPKGSNSPGVMSVYSLSWKSSSPVRTLISWLPCFPPKTSLPAVLHRPRPSTPVMLQQTTWPGHLIRSPDQCQPYMSDQCEQVCEGWTHLQFDSNRVSYETSHLYERCRRFQLQPRPHTDHVPVQTRPCKPRPHIDHDAWCHYNSRQ